MVDGTELIWFDSAKREIAEIQQNHIHAFLD